MISETNCRCREALIGVCWGKSMKSFFLYAGIWSPGALAVLGFLISMVTSRKVASGELALIDGYYTILPWVWIPGFLLVPATILGVALLVKLRWSALLQLGASVGLVLAWVFFVDSGMIQQRESNGNQAVSGSLR
jgi:hypothetical protein